MPEEYVGVKFNLIKEKGSIPKNEYSKFQKIIKLTRKYFPLKGNEGNTSIRSKLGMIVKATATPMGKGEVVGVLVTKIEGEDVYAIGGTPSSESRMHWEIYQERKDVKIIFHFHSEKLMKKEWKFAKTIEKPYGTIELAKEVLRATKKSDLIKVIGHGFTILAKDEKDLIEKIKTI